MRLVLDAEAVSALLDPRHRAERKIRQGMEAARRLGRDVAIATGTLGELYRGAGRNQALDALLARESARGLVLRDTDRTLARLIGALLTEAGADSALFADAHPVAVAVEAGGGVVQTADPDDLGRLAAPYRTVVIEPIAPGAHGSQRGRGSSPRR
jgi:predicted nucleic acid-binding protein